jgi:hypothetical protein
MVFIWNKTDNLLFPNGVKTPAEIFLSYPWSKTVSAVVTTDAEGIVTGWDRLGILMSNNGVENVETDTPEVKLQKVLVKIQDFRNAEAARVAAEAQAKADAQRDQYLRDCNAELATVTAMPDVTPVDEPVVEDTRYLNYKWNYDNGFWNKTALRLTVQKGMISKQEYQAITGEVYQ